MVKVMEIRVLEYFVAIVENKSITAAANSLYISQSTLSRQIMDLEDELNVKLFDRGHRQIALTESGTFLYERAKEILQLSIDTEKILSSNDIVAGTIRIGIGEGEVNDFILTDLKQILDEHREVNLDYQTLNADQIYRDIDLGLLDFGVIWTNEALTHYDYLELPFYNEWGVLFLKDDPLSRHENIVANDLHSCDMILPRQLDVNSDLKQYLKEYVENNRITATYDMNYNMLALVRSKIGVALTFNKPDYEYLSEFTFKKLQYLKPVGVKIIWKPNRKLTKLSSSFLEQLRLSLDEATNK